jgi:hypothetical protein
MGKMKVEDGVVAAFAEKIRAAYLDTAINSYEDAAANGLCAEGAWEVAVGALRGLDISDLLQQMNQEQVYQFSDDQISSRLPSGSRR